MLAELDDFYGVNIACVTLGYIRPEANFSNVEELKWAIAEDVEYARRQLETPLGREYLEKNLAWAREEPINKL